MVARVNIGQEEAAILLRTLSGSTCDNLEILGNEVLHNKVFREKLAAIFAVTLCLTIVWHLLLLPKTNEFLQLVGQALDNIALIFLHFHTGIYLWPQLWLFWNMLWARRKFHKVSIPAVWWKQELFCNCNSRKYHCRSWMLIHFLWCWRFTDNLKLAWQVVCDVIMLIPYWERTNLYRDGRAGLRGYIMTRHYSKGN